MNHTARKMADFIKTKRNQFKITQTQLGITLGYSTKQGQVISNIERGLQQLPCAYINKLSIIFQTPRDEIINLYVEDFKQSLIEELNK